MWLTFTHYPTIKSFELHSRDYRLMNDRSLINLLNLWNLIRIKKKRDLTDLLYIKRQNIFHVSAITAIFFKHDKQISRVIPLAGIIICQNRKSTLFEVPVFLFDRFVLRKQIRQDNKIKLSNSFSLFSFDVFKYFKKKISTEKNLGGDSPGIRRCVLIAQ